MAGMTRRCLFRCETCGYDLRRNESGRCPECGVVVPRLPRMPPQWRILIWALGAATSLLALALVAAAFIRWG